MPGLATTFNQNTQNGETAPFDFEAEVAQAWRDFPETKGKILFFRADDNGAELVFPAGFEGRDVAEACAEWVDAPARARSAFARWGVKNSFCQPWSGTRLVFLIEDKHPYDKLRHDAPVAMETTFVFDHEFAHASIAEAGYALSDKTRAESIADAYATIRHFQRYGADSPYIDAVPANRAFDLVFRESWYGTSHFTSPSVAALLAQRHKVDWNALSPEETAEFAIQTVLENELPYAQMKQLREAFKPFEKKEKALQEGDAAPLRALAELVLHTSVNDVIRYGGAAVQLTLTRDAALLPEGENWKALRRKLARRQRRAARRSRPFLSITPKL